MGRLRVAGSGEVGRASPISPPLVAPADRWSKYFSELTFSGSLTLVHNAFCARYHVLLAASQTSTET